MRDLRTFALLLLFAIAASGQMLVSARTRIGGGSATYRPVPVRPKSVNALVSYQLHEAKMQTLADGTHITQTMLVQRFWRDSQGGTRLERSYVALGNGNQQERIWPIAEITNPGAGFWYVLEVEKKIAHRGRLSAPPPTAAPRVRPLRRFQAPKITARRRSTA
jgi:hypothetical protein